MYNNPLVDQSKAFAVHIIQLSELIRSRGKATAITNQLLRSGTSIGANIHEANYAASKADFINKLQIALKECFETEYWLDIFHEASIIDDDEYSDSRAQCGRIRKMLTSSVNTAKNGNENHRR